MPKECAVCGQAYSKRGKCCGPACSQILRSEFSEQIRARKGPLWSDYASKRRKGVLAWADRLRKTTKEN